MFVQRGELISWEKNETLYADIEPVNPEKSIVLVTASGGFSGTDQIHDRGSVIAEIISATRVRFRKRTELSTGSEQLRIAWEVVSFD